MSKKILNSKGLAPLIIILIVSVIGISGIITLKDLSAKPQPSLENKEATEPAQISSPSTSNFPSLVPSNKPSAKASSKPLTSPSPTPSVTPAPQNSFNLEMTCLGLDPTNYYPTNKAKITAKGKVYNAGSGGIWATLTDEKNIHTVLFFGANYGTTPYDFDFTASQDIRDIRTDKHPVSLIGEPDRKYVVRIYSAPYSDGSPNLTDLLYQQTFNKDCRY